MVPDDTEELIARACGRTVALRLGASDVAGKALLTAAQRLDEYLDKLPLPFYPWLRRLTWEQLLRTQQLHLRASWPSRKGPSRHATAGPWPACVACSAPTCEGTSHDRARRQPGRIIPD